LQGYQYLSNGRCWTIDKLSEESFHFVPLSIPANARFVMNISLDGEPCGVWTYSAEIFDSATIFVRYGDNAPLRFAFSNSLFFPFTFTITNTRFVVGASPSNWRPPAGNCPNHTFGPSTNPFTFLKQVLRTNTHTKDFVDNFFGPGQRLHSGTQKRTTRLQDPTPPTLHQFFSSQYVLGYGAITQANKWVQPNNIFKGQLYVDKISGGFYWSILDNQDANVPWTFSTTFITTPTPNAVNGYQFLQNGRCWTLGFADNPDIPISIPADATFVGKFTVDGTPVQIWEFPYSSTYGNAKVQIAVVVPDNTILFINIGVEAFLYEAGTYFYFQNFNTSKPDPSTYQTPPGPCPDLATPRK